MKSVLSEKVKKEPLSPKEALELFQNADLLDLGLMAKNIKFSKSGNKVYFTINKHINYTNICSSKCLMCAYYKNEDDKDAYTMTFEQVEEELSNIEDLHEVHIVGALNPKLDFSYYIKLLETVKKAAPNANIKAFTAAEIDFFSKISSLSYKEVLEKLKAAGLQTMPGGGAEVFSERVRRKLYPKKIGFEEWAQIHTLAHSMGIKSNATLLFGHIETQEEIVDHLFKLRNLQAQTKGFLCFVPLLFHPKNTIFEKQIQKQSAVFQLKVLAISRIILDNFDHIKAYWVMMQDSISQVGLHFGADDIDGTIEKENIFHAAGATSPSGMARQKIIEMVKNAGFVPVERDALYNELKVCK
ncbi:MAG TPA: aminofutalosine synthase MqnE [Desulfurella acetivorans]|uniref:Aminodeoxyfutalosine synthase n=1 Tax=Desulfurella acetivorans TaxID=33002 RepID=A0A7C6EAQ3_DESAE|nr:aminofutalosine synthase MqnE [Desulfurella acetivorans]